MAHLPSGIRETFERPTRGPHLPTAGTNGQGNPTIEMPDPNKPFPEIDNYRDIAAIVAAGDPALQQGTAMDAALLQKSEEIMHGIDNPPFFPGAENVDMLQQQIDPGLQEMLSAAGRDQMAVHNELAGADGKSPNNAFIEDLMTHQWADDGAAASSLLNGTGAVPTDLTDPTQIAQATRVGETMHAVDQWVANTDNTKNLLDIPGTGNQSLGQVNPDLAVALAEANKPYIDDMGGNPLDASQGFTPMDDGSNTQMPGMRNLFAVIDTHAGAAEILNGQAYANGMHYQAQFEQSIINGGPVDTGDLQSAGTLKGVIDSAANMADNDAIAYGNLQEVNAYESRGQWFEFAKTVGGEIPLVKSILDWNGKVPGDPLQSIFVGDAPVGADPKQIVQQTSDAMQYAVAQRLLDANLGNAGIFDQYDLINPDTRQLSPLTDDLSDFRSAFTNYFNGINDNIKDGIEDYEDGYRDAMPNATAQPG